MIRLAMIFIVTFLMVTDAGAEPRWHGDGHRGGWHGQRHHPSGRHWYRPYARPEPLDGLVGGIIGGFLGTILNPPPPPPPVYYEREPGQ
jgi:hypothetical protein